MIADNCAGKENGLLLLAFLVRNPVFGCSVGDLPQIVGRKDRRADKAICAGKGGMEDEIQFFGGEQDG